MEIVCLTVGDLATNCYLVTDEKTRKTIIIDPGDEGDFISTTLLEKNLLPQAVLLTHGHYDHCLAALELKLNFSIPIYLHQADLFLYKKAHQSSSFWNSSLRGAYPRRGNLTPPKLPPIDHFLVDNDIITFGDSSLKVIHTPGHTPGSVCLLSPPVIASFGIPNRGQPACRQAGLTPPTAILFTGDTLFLNGVGSTDHAYSSRSDLKKSLTKLSSEISDLKSTLIYPGHENNGVLASPLDKCAPLCYYRISNHPATSSGGTFKKE